MAETVPAATTPVNLRQELSARLKSARSHTDKLFQIVRPEALYDRPIPERHRIIFYLGHLEAFDWNLLGQKSLGNDSFHTQFDRLFAFGIDPVESGLPNDRPSDWPARAEIDGYNARIRQTIDDGLERASFEEPNQPLLHREFVLHVAIEHRLMHAETLAYMLHQLPLKRKFSHGTAPTPSAPPSAPRLVVIPTGHATLGRPRRTSGGFGWDNEFEAYPMTVPEFAIDAYDVTNRQFLNFMLAGGYDNRDLWDEGGWEWTSTLFAPFAGFQAFPFYRGYSADFFDGKHYVVKGGSSRTSACLLRRSFRNWFQPHYPYAYAAFRGVVNQ